MSQVITKLTLIIELKRRIESSFENKTQYLNLFKEKLKQNKRKKNSNNDSPNCLLNTKIS